MDAILLRQPVAWFLVTATRRRRVAGHQGGFRRTRLCRLFELRLLQERTGRQQTRAGGVAEILRTTRAFAVRSKEERADVVYLPKAEQERRQMLTARQVTDIAVIDIMQLVNADLAVATTLAHAFRLAGTQLLSLDSRELGSFVMRTDSGPHCGLVLFDSMPGGDGHVAELLESATDWIGKLIDDLFVNEAHHQRCVSACLDCLLSYETQFDHDQGLLARATTWEFWDCLRNHRAWSSSASHASPRALARNVRNRGFGTVSTGSLGTGATKAKAVGSAITSGKEHVARRPQTAAGSERATAVAYCALERSGES